MKAHRGQVMQKMKADSFADLVKMATRLHLERVVRHLPRVERTYTFAHSMG